MTTITVAPAVDEELYQLLLEKERELRQLGRGTLHRKGPRKAGQEKWVHTSFKGSIKLQRGLGGHVVALVQGAAERDEWQLVASFIGFLQRHFRLAIGSVTLTFGPSEFQT
jgi:hypothetical protein